MEKSKGQVKKAEDGFKVVFERILQHDIHEVWDAITNPEKLKIWFTDFEMNFKEGEKINIIFRDKAKTITHGEIISIKAPHKFVWTWEGELAEWELINMGDKKCKLIFTYSKMSDNYAVGTAGGFHTLLDRVEKMLDGSNETYAFGTEEFDPIQVALREEYGKIIFKEYPELQVYNPLKQERIFNVSSALLWEVLTNKEHLKQWYFDFADDWKLEIGNQFDWKATSPDCVEWLHRGKMLEIITGKKISHTWEYPGYKGSSVVTWELDAINSDTTRLILTHEFIIPFDTAVEALRRENFVEGWTAIIHTSLKEYLEKLC